MTSRLSLKWITVCLVTFAVGCAKDEGPIFIPKAVVPGEAIDTAYFSTEVVPIFIQHCWTCHPDMGGLDLGATMAFSNLVNVTSTNHAPAVRVVPGDPWRRCSGTKFRNLPPMG